MAEINNDNSYSIEIECPICLNNIILTNPYAMIDNIGEIGKYHISCLQQWLAIRKSGEKKVRNALFRAG